MYIKKEAVLRLPYNHYLLLYSRILPLAKYASSNNRIKFDEALEFYRELSILF